LTITIEPGSLFGGRYRIESLIGRGSQSTVYRCYDQQLRREVAVKLFRADPEGPGAVRLQRQEARILAGMSHHALVMLLDAGSDHDDDGQELSYLVMEFVPGQDLRHRTLRGPLSAAHMAHIGYDLAEGLSYIHHHGVVHRDVKPGNVLLVDYSNQDRRPRAKLTDFGVACFADAPEDDAEDGGTSGTPAYLSPEQASGGPAGPASDVYSLGLVLLEGLTGNMAYPGAPIQSAVARLLHDPKIPDGLAPKWAELLASMLSRDPADRPAAREVALALRQEIISTSGRRRRGAPVPDEAGRMLAVERYGVLDTPADGSFDRIAALAARVFSVPVAIISVVDHDRIWFKAHHGTDVTEIGRDPGLCASAILQDGPWIVNDATHDARTLANPLVAGDFGLQFYAGIPLRTPDGYNLGTFCILDREPRDFSEEETRTLEDLAALVMNDLELRLRGRELAAG